MKKRLFLILSVTIMLAAGCGNKDNTMPDMETEVAETVIDTEEPDMVEDKEVPAADQAESGDAEKEQREKGMEEEAAQEEGDKAEEETPDSKPASQPEQKEETEPAQVSTDVPKQDEAKQEETKPEDAKAECETKPEEPEPEETKQQEPAVTAYDPVSVCSQAVAKCQASGMITTTDNLASLLAEGKITQEEYNSYYPYDGLGYYSVFVETDLNEASTTSGRKLGSVEGIADYIAGMMLLETEPVFYIEYAGVYNLNGTDFYEFRCYR